MSVENNTDGIAAQEWSHFIDSGQIGMKPVTLKISLPDENKDAVSKRLNLDSIERLQVEIRLQRNSVNKVIYVQGSIIADLCQRCVVTTQPVSEHVEDSFEAWFIEPNQTVSFAKAKRERLNLKEKNEQPILEESEDPEDVIDGKIDLGELIVQNLSLSLNPYPRIEDANHEAGEDLEAAPEGTYDNPFAALKDWKQSEAKKDK